MNNYSKVSPNQNHLVDQEENERWSPPSIEVGDWLQEESSGRFWEIVNIEGERVTLAPDTEVFHIDIDDVGIDYIKV